MIEIGHGLSIDEAALEERFVRASGPGGQNVNQVATAVQLRFDVTGSSLPAAVKARALALAGARATRDGVIVIQAREHRTQERNRAAARARLIALLIEAATPPRKRKPTRTPARARAARLDAKKRRSGVKQTRGRVDPDA